MEKLCIVYVTASGKDEAMKIGEKLVSLKLAACCNVYDGVTSFYRWEGKEEKSSESTLIIKTKESLLPKLEKEIKKLHSYSCPCILATPIVYANEDYARWIVSETK